MRIRELVLVVAIVASGGCNAMLNGLLDPTQVGRFRGKSVTQDLRRSVSVADEPMTEIESTEPTAEDLQVENKDYVLLPGDLIDLSIFELMVPGQPWVETRQISWEGYITIPQIRQDVLVSGKSARELGKYVEKVLQEAQILAQPEVTVLVREARNMTFNILGAVGNPRSDMIPRPNFRVLDALAMAGGVNPVGGPQQPLVKMVYVFRNIEASRNKRATTTTNMTSEISEGEVPVNFATVGSGGVGSGEESGHWVYANGEWKFIKEAKEEVRVSPVPARRTVEHPRKEVAVPVTAKPSTAPKLLERPKMRGPEIKPVEEKPVSPATGPSGEGWEDVAARIPSQRVIAIPLDKLQMGDRRYNVVIHDGDTVWVPPPTQGEFYVMGNVLRPGVFSLTGREVTIRQGISAAGGLGPLADPTRTELIRRIGGNQEQVLTINMDRVFAGKEADIILKPDDIINIGTNPVTPFLAVLRNAFRLTYGFGFVYDRNFADIDSFSGQQNPTDRRRAEQQTRFGF
ncbi:MAG: SLBB domain-containing protein [Phycisphaerae bacterium]